MLFRNISTTVLTQFAILFLGIFTSMIISRGLHPDGKGVLAVYLTVVNLFFALTTLGLPKAYTFEVSRNKGKPAVVQNAMSIGLMNGVVTGLLATVAASSGIGGVFDDLPGGILWFAIPTTMTLAILGAFSSIVRGMNRITEFNVGLLLHQSLYLGLNLGIWVTVGLTVEHVFVVFFVCKFVNLVYYLQVIWRRVPGLRLNLSIVTGFFHYGLRYLILSAVNALHNQVDVLILGILLTSVDVGYYSTAVSLAQLLWNLPNAITLVLLPYVAGREDGDDVSVRTAQITRMSTIVLIIAGLILAIIAPLVISTLYGAAFLPSVSPLRFLLPGIIAFNVVNVAGAHVLGRNRIFPLTIISSICVFFNIILNLILIPRIGPDGAALASTITYSVDAVAVAWLLCREGYVKLWDVLVPRWSDIRVMWYTSIKHLRPILNHMNMKL